MVAIAMWLGSGVVLPLAWSAMPTRFEQVVGQAVGLVEDAREDEGDGDRGDDERDEHAHPPEGLGAEAPVEQARDDEGDRRAAGSRTAGRC